jgi:predicted HicB family RNase H-like nuclease
MSDPGFASLGPTLLARKGGAKPAMRPQVGPLMQDATPLAEEQLEDLGWNDLGDDHEGDHPASVVVPILPDAGFDAASLGASPVVRKQQRRLEERVLADAVMTANDADWEGDEEGYAEDEGAEDIAGFVDDCTVKTQETSTAIASKPVKAPRPKAIAAPQDSGRRAAFTLRLDPERHLKLRLAATMQGISAQVLVTNALDAMLAEIDDLDLIASRIKRH